MPISLRHHRDSKLWALSAGDVSIWPMGPAGGSGGTWFNDVADQRLNIPTVSVLRVEGRHGDTLDSLSVTYQSAGLSAGPFKHGTSGGGQDYSNFVMGRGDRLIMVEGWIHVFSLNHELNGLRFTHRDQTARSTLVWWARQTAQVLRFNQCSLVRLYVSSEDKGSLLMRSASFIGHCRVKQKSRAPLCWDVLEAEGAMSHPY